MSPRRIGYFCTASFTETGGIDALLRKLDPHAVWVRCFPAVDKPAPKLGRDFARPRQGTGHGATGQHLRERMLRTLREHYRAPDCPFDMVVLIDDADCRFGADGLQSFCQEMTESIRRETGRADLGFAALLAFPEIEAWLLSDWEEGFGAHYRSISVPLRIHLEKELLGPRQLDWDHIEDYGGAQLNGSCAHKLSSDVQHALSAGFAGQSYSKQLDGPSMLMRVRPAQIAARCPLARRGFAALAPAARP